MEPDSTITCVDCGETAHLLTHPPEDGRWQPGEVVVYRCSGCGDRWDLVVPGEDTSEFFSAPAEATWGGGGVVGGDPTDDEDW